MFLTVPQVIAIAKISQYLCLVDIKKSGLNGGGIELDLPHKLRIVREDIEYQYNLDSTNDTLVTTSEYLYALCGKYALYAQNITGGGGIIAPTSGGTAPLPLQFIVAASGTTFIDGQISVTLTNFIGYNLLFSRGGIPQSTVTTEPTYYSWNRNSGLLTLNIAAITGELFQIYPV